MAGPIEAVITTVAKWRNVWDSVRAVTSKKRSTIVTALSESGRYGLGEQPLYGVQERALKSSWLYTGLRLIASEVVAAELKILQEQPDSEEASEHVPNHPMIKKLKRPNPFMGRAFLWEYSIDWLYLSGNFYWFMLLDEMGRIDEIWPLPARDVTPFPPEDQESTNDFIAYYEYVAVGSTYRIPSEYVVHVRFPNPFDPFVGLSPLAAAILPVDSDLAMSRWNALFFGHDNVMPNAIINLSSGDPDQPIAPSDVQALKDDLRTDYAAHRRKTAITSAQKIEVELLGYNPRDLDFVQGREMMRNEIFSVLGIPSGILDSATSQLVFGNTTQSERMLKNTVNGVLVIIAEQLTVEMVMPYYGDQYEAQFEDIRPINRESTMTEVGAVSPFLTIDEIRLTYLEKDPLPGGRGKLLVNDPAPETLIQAMVVSGVSEEGGLAGVEGPLGQNEEKPSREKIEALARQAIAKRRNEKNVALVPMVDASGTTIGYVYTGNNRNIPDVEPPEGVSLLGYANAETELRQWRKKSLKAITRGEEPQVPFTSESIPDILVLDVNSRLYGATSREEVKSIFIEAFAELENAKAIGDKWRPWANRVARLRKDITQAMRDSVKPLTNLVKDQGPPVLQQRSLWEDFRARLGDKVGESLGKLVNDAINRVERQQPDITDWEQNRERAAQWAGNHAASRITRVSDGMRREVQKLLADWAARGGTEAELISQLEELFGSEHRARMIATTEATDMYAESTAQALEAAGVPRVVFKPTAHIQCRCFVLPYKLPSGNSVAVWYTFRDERVCEDEFKVPWGNGFVDGCKALHNVVVSEGPYLGQKIDRAAAFDRRSQSAQAIMNKRR